MANINARMIVTEAMQAEIDKRLDDSIGAVSRGIEDLQRENAALRNALEECAARQLEAETFLLTDYAELSDRLLAAKDDDVTAILSNNFNIVLGALRVVVTQGKAPTTDIQRSVLDGTFAVRSATDEEREATA